jgi:hypothetical protein
MILEFQKIDGNLVPYSAQCKRVMGQAVDRSILKLKVADTDVGSLSMSKTWRMWMAEVATHMCHMGCSMPLYYDGDGNPHGERRFNKNDAHELFTSKFLGSNNAGDRLSWQMDSDGGASVATREQRLFAMDKLDTWAAERGIRITIPRLGAYAEYREMQEQ